MTTTAISREHLNLILRRWLGEPVNLASCKALQGGMMHAVLGLEFDKAPYRAVIKVSREPWHSFKPKAYMQEYIRQTSAAPSPEVYAVADGGEVVPEAYLLMEQMPGVHLGEAEMTKPERQAFEVEFAEVLLEMHSHTRDTYGSLNGSETYVDWLDWLTPIITLNCEKSVPHLKPETAQTIPHLLELLPQVFANQGTPSLVHGDLWSTNIMVEKQDESWVLTGLVDPGAMFADVEYELAYMQCFGTVTSAFFERYHRDRPMRDGYPLRRLYYWLNTMLLHVWLFGDAPYVNRTDRIVEDIVRHWSSRT